MKTPSELGRSYRIAGLSPLELAETLALKVLEAEFQEPLLLVYSGKDQLLVSSSVPPESKSRLILIGVALRLFSRKEPRALSKALEFHPELPQDLKDRVWQFILSYLDYAEAE